MHRKSTARPYTLCCSWCSLPGSEWGAKVQFMQGVREEIVNAPAYVRLCVCACGCNKQPTNQPTYDASLLVVCSILLFAARCAGCQVSAMQTIVRSQAMFDYRCRQGLVDDHVDLWCMRVRTCFGRGIAGKVCTCLLQIYLYASTLTRTGALAVCYDTQTHHKPWQFRRQHRGLSQQQCHPRRPVRRARLRGDAK